MATCYARAVIVGGNPRVVSRTSSTAIDDLVATVQRVEGKLDHLVALFENQPGNLPAWFDPTDAACLLAIRTATLGGSFSARELIDHSALDPALRDALLACDIEDAVDCGQWCKRLRGVVLNGLLIERDKRTSGGVRWRVRLQG